jgi:hypothetical protein
MLVDSFAKINISYSPERFAAMDGTQKQAQDLA